LIYLALLLRNVVRSLLQNIDHVKMLYVNLRNLFHCCFLCVDFCCTFYSVLSIILWWIKMYIYTWAPWGWGTIKALYKPLTYTFYIFATCHQLPCASDFVAISAGCLTCRTPSISKWKDSLYQALLIISLDLLELQFTVYITVAFYTFLTNLVWINLLDINFKRRSVTRVFFFKSLTPTLYRLLFENSRKYIQRKYNYWQKI